MSTFQQVKPKNVTSTTTTTSITCEQSQKLVQTMLTMSFGCLAFLRGLFPDENFADQRFVPEKVRKGYDKDRSATQSSSIKIKTLVRGKTLEADLFLDWLEKGVFQSIRHKYLKGLSLGVFAQEDAPTELIEDYLFSFSYGDDGQVHLSMNGENESISLLDSRKVVQQLMRRFIIITQSLEPLPEKRFLSMRLLFNENTPADYQPLLFKDVSRERPATVQVPASTDLDTYSVGSLDTRHHKVALKVLSVVETGDASAKTITRNVDPFSLIEESESLDDETSSASQTIEGPSQTSRCLQGLLSSQSDSVAQTQYLADNRADYECQCETPFPQTGTHWLTCSTCKRKLHKVCYGNLSHGTISKCLSCLNRNNVVDFTAIAFKVLMMLRRIYRFWIKKPKFPSEVSELYKVLAGEQPGSDVIDIINLALSILFSDDVLVLEKERRKQARRTQYLRSSDYIYVDHRGIMVKGIGELSAPSRVVWTFVFNSPNAQSAYTNVTFGSLELLQDALQNVERSLAMIARMQHSAAQNLIARNSSGSSLEFSSLRIDDDTQNTLESNKRSHQSLTPDLDIGRDHDFEDIANEQNSNTTKIRKISASKKTLRSVW
ncbi:LAFA_0B06568g1_1 [Lachancea sp. 'fantastica']|nr:LAFA_0B06568g1_1 [Lachancea sp. 'fantastica']